MTPLVLGQWSFCSGCAQSGEQLNISCVVVVGNASVMGGSIMLPWQPMLSVVILYVNPSV